MTATIMVALVACNQTVGDCYPRGQGDGTIGAGAGVITSGGVGASGEGPPEQPQNVEYPQDECNAPADGDPGDDSTEASLKVFCKTPDMGPTCSARCFDKGVACVPFAYHPQKPDSETGKLFSCNSLLLGFMCGYHYPNGDDCYFRFGFPGPPLCSYSGN
ncbi:MAG: hypothetical protein QM820_63485 [Minicystis sp.]